MPPDSHNLTTSDSDLDSGVEKRQRRNSIGPKYFCTINGGCGTSFKRADDLDSHEYHHTGVKKHICLQEGCNKSYSILTHLKRHVRISHERNESDAPKKTIKCSVQDCEKLFCTPCGMQRHVRETHEYPKEYICHHCNARFMKKFKLHRHEIAEHTRAFSYKCEKCERGFHQRWQHEKHTANCKVYPCANCELKFEKWTLYLKHCRETQHGKKEYKCDHCERSYDKQIDLSKHVAAKHHRQETSTNTESATVTTFSCKEEGCNRNYAYERNLRQHILTAHDGRRFECTFEGCDRCFSSSQNLVKHLIRDHNDDKDNPQAEENAHNEKRISKESRTIKKRKKRKDAGKKKLSHLSRLTGLDVNRTLDRQLSERCPIALETVIQHKLSEEQQILDAQDKAKEEDAIVSVMFNKVLAEVEV